MTISVYYHDTPEIVSTALEWFTCATRLDATQVEAWRWRGVMFSETHQGPAVSATTTTMSSEERALENFEYARYLDPNDLENYHYQILYM